MSFLTLLIRLPIVHGHQQSLISVFIKITFKHYFSWDEPYFYQPTNQSPFLSTQIDAQNITLRANYKRCAFIIYQIRLFFTPGSS